MVGTLWYRQEQVKYQGFSALTCFAGVPIGEPIILAATASPLGLRLANMVDLNQASRTPQAIQDLEICQTSSLPQATYKPLLDCCLP